MIDFRCFRLFAVGFFVAISIVSAQTAGKPVRYTLLSDSEFIDDCLFCGRPTIFVPMRGSFDLVEDQIGPLFTTYRIENLNFRGGAGTNETYRIVGSGTYRFGGQLAVFQDMTLNLTVNGKPAVLTNEDRVATWQLPLIKTSLSQTNPDFANFFKMELFAAPVRDLWFSIERQALLFKRGLRQIEPWEILSVDGHVVKDWRLQENLGIPVRDRAPTPIDAIDVQQGGDIWFSFSYPEFSDTLGEIREGDIVSARGTIVRHNQDLTRPFQPLLPDQGLDALAVRDDGEILFSTRSNFFSTRLATMIKRGDLLSDRGQIVYSNEQLLSAFHPTVAKDYGLDAVHIWPNGEVWFSTEEGFQDSQLGEIKEGDLLSNLGYVAFRNADLLVNFVPEDARPDYGLDTLFIITDTIQPIAGPRITKTVVNRSTGDVSLQWQGPGRVFQVEKAGVVTGPYLPPSPIQPDAEFVDPAAARNSAAGFYRVRQW